MSARAADVPRTYKFSPVNQFGVELTASHWNPIIQYVSAKSGVNLVLKIGRTSADTTSYVLAKEVEFAFTNHLFNENRRRMGWRLLVRRDYPAVQGQILTTADSPVTDLKQLADEEVVFPGREAFIPYESFVPYKVTHAHLLASQADPGDRRHPHLLRPRGLHRPVRRPHRAGAAGPDEGLCAAMAGRPVHGALLRREPRHLRGRAR